MGGFCAIHDELKRLGLPFADSMFAYQMPGAQEYTFSYLSYPSLSPSPHAGILREMIRKGEIDTLHALGNHSGVGGVDRLMIRAAARLLIEDGLHFPVWTNHGDDKNIQNIRAGSGDDPVRPPISPTSLTGSA